MREPVTWRTAALLTLPPLLWAGNAVIGSVMVAHIPPLTLNALRWTLAFVFLLPFGWRVFTRPREIADRWRHLALIGLLGIGCYNAFQYLALTSSSPLNVTLIAASSSLWMLLIGWIGFGVAPVWRQGVGASLSIAGVLLVLSRGDFEALVGLRFVAGDVYMVIATIAWGIYSWLLARPPASMREPDRPRWDWAQFLMVQLMFGMTWTVIAAAAEQAVRPAMPQWTLPLVAAMVYVAAGPALVAYWAWGAGVSRVGPTVAALFSNLTPLFTALLSLVALGQAPEWYHGVAFVLIGAGIAISSRRRG
jgi:drug/metabolite transporter (DMT)-like permease